MNKNFKLIFKKLSKKISFNWIAVFIIITTVFGVYANTINNPFIWDDEEIIVGNALIRDWKNFSEIFKADVFGKTVKKGNFYRPLQVFSYSIDYKFWKLWEPGYHIVNIFLHAISALLLFCLLKKLEIKKHLAFLGALIFAVHPISIESATYISGRGDALFLFFSLLCFLFYLKGKQEKTWNYIVCALFFVLAIFSKESAIVLPFIILLYYIIFLRGKEKKRALLAVLGLCGIAFLYTIIRLAIMGIKGSSSLSIINEATFWERVLCIPRTIITYMRILAFPQNLHMEYLFLEKSLTSAWVWGSVIFIPIFLYFAIKYIKPRKMAIFFVVWFFLGLAPFYNIFPVLSSSLREHWAHLSQIGFIGLLVLGFNELIKSNKKYIQVGAVLGIAILISYYATTTINRNKDWSDPMKLYAHDVIYEPKSFLLHNNLGVEYYRNGEIEKAKQSFLNSIEASPGRAYDVAYNNLGAILQKKGDIDEAILQYKKSIELGDYKLAYSNLGKAYLIQNKTRQALEILEKGYGLYPRNLSMQYYLGISYFMENRITKAYEIFQAIQKTAPEYENINYYIEEIKQKMRN